MMNRLESVVRFMSSSSSWRSSSFAFQSSKFGSSSISNRLAQVVEMMIELEPSFWNRTGRQNDKSARGHETTQRLPMDITATECKLMEVKKFSAEYHEIDVK